MKKKNIKNDELLDQLGEINYNLECINNTLMAIAKVIEVR